MNICLFTQEEIQKPLSLRDERAKHILTVLHKKEGDSFDAGIIDGAAGIATITKITKNEITKNGKTFTDGELFFTFQEKSDGKPLYPLYMIIGFPRPIQLKRLLRDIAGLGAKSVMLTGTELGEKSYMSSNLASEESAREMLLQGTIQAASTNVPAVHTVKTLEESIMQTVELIKKQMPEKKLLCLALDNIRPTESLSAYLAKNVQEPENTVAIAAIGSERGWTDNERDLMERSGFTLLGMGCRVLRTETAATVAASLILSAMEKI